MSFSTNLFDFEFDAAHLLKKISYVCVPTGLLVSMSTIFLNERTGARALDAALKRSKNVLLELERINQELDDFAYIASHDLKEPLRGIHNYSQFLIEDYSAQLDQEGRDKLETLEEAGDADGRSYQRVVGFLACGTGRADTLSRQHGCTGLVSTRCPESRSGRD